MTDSATATNNAGDASPATPKKTTKGKDSKKARIKPSHPKTADMVTAAIKNLKERGGSSLQAIKKYIATNYKVDAEKLAPFIRKYLKAAVTSGTLVQTKGKGASGSFKLNAGGEKPVAKKPKPVKTGTPTKMKKAKTEPKKGTTAAAKKAKTVKKPASPKKTTTTAAAKPKTAKAASPSKAKKAAKVPTKKPKAPKPKKVTKPKSPAKKAAPKKK